MKKRKYLIISVVLDFDKPDKLESLKVYDYTDSDHNGVEVSSDEILTKKYEDVCNDIENGRAEYHKKIIRGFNKRDFKQELVIDDKCLTIEEINELDSYLY